MLDSKDYEIWLITGSQHLYDGSAGSISVVMARNYDVVHHFQIESNGP